MKLARTILTMGKNAGRNAAAQHSPSMVAESQANFGVKNKKGKKQKH